MNYVRKMYNNLFQVKCHILCILCIFMILSFQSKAQENKYTGYRVELTNIQLVKQTKDENVINFDVTNTGSEHLVLGSKASLNLNIQIIFEDTYIVSDTANVRQAIKNKLLKTPIYLPIGESKKFKKFVFSTFQPDEKMKIPSDKSIAEKIGCPDLIIDTIIVTQLKKKSAQIQFRLVNKGNATAVLLDTQKAGSEPVAILAYLNGTQVLSRSALNVGGIKMKNMLKNAELRIRESVFLSMKLDLSDKTRFTKVLILQIDPYLQLDECDKTNNNFSVILK